MTGQLKWMNKQQIVMSNVSKNEFKKAKLFLGSYIQSYFWRKERKCPTFSMDHICPVMNTLIFKTNPELNAARK